MNKRNQYSAEFKTKVVLEVLREEATVNEIAAQHGLNPMMVSRWKTEFLERASDVFKRGPSDADKELATKKELFARLEKKVGQLTYEVDWLKKNLKKLSCAGLMKSIPMNRPETIGPLRKFCGGKRT